MCEMLLCYAVSSHQSCSTNITAASLLTEIAKMLAEIAWKYHMLLACPEQPNHLPVFLEYRKSFKDNWYVV